MRVADMTWMDVERYLERDDRCVLPLGSVEQHAYLSLCVDAILSERVAVEAAEPLGVPVFPALAYGVTPYFMAYPGTVSITRETYEAVLRDALSSLATHGFARIVVVNGHGGNAAARPAAAAWAEEAGMTLRWHDWWRGPRFAAAVREVDAHASHASWMESFAWTRVASTMPPSGSKPPVDLSDRDERTPEELRRRLGDGSLGGRYARPPEDEARVWVVGVEETRDVIRAPERP